MVSWCACFNDCFRYFKYHYFLSPLALLMLPLFLDWHWLVCKQLKQKFFCCTCSNRWDNCLQPHYFLMHSCFSFKIRALTQLFLLLWLQSHSAYCQHRMENHMKTITALRCKTWNCSRRITNKMFVIWYLLSMRHQKFLFSFHIFPFFKISVTFSLQNQSLSTYNNIFAF